jgi:hypothetical protein
MANKIIQENYNYRIALYQTQNMLVKALLKERQTSRSLIISTTHPNQWRAWTVAAFIHFNHSEDVK